jgi:hypothetical protein
MSLLAADCANASNAEAETSLDTVSTADSWVAPSSLSQVESEVEGVMDKVAKVASKAVAPKSSKSKKISKGKGKGKAGGGKPAPVKKVSASGNGKKPVAKVTKKTDKPAKDTKGKPSTKKPSTKPTKPVK